MADSESMGPAAIPGVEAESALAIPEAPAAPGDDANAR